MLFRVALAIFAASHLVFSAPVLAFEVKPMRHSIVPAEGQSSGIIRVTNPRTAALPVELVVQKRVFDKDGNITLVDADEDFVIFPFQALIEPNKTQAFRFQYVGSPAISEAIAYTIDVREVPVDLPEGFSGFRFVYNFGVVVYVNVPDTKSNISIEAVERMDESLKLRFRNNGASFGRLSNDRLILEQNGKLIVLDGEDLTSRINNVVIPPNGAATVVLQLRELDIYAGVISVKVRETPD